jgi:hypothetical protein
VRNESVCSKSGSQHLLSVAFLLGILVTLGSPHAAHAVEILNGSGWSVNTRGFVAFDMNWDKNDLGASEPLLPAPNDSAQAANHALRFSASQSQIGFFVLPPQEGGISTDAYLEIDFLKGLVAPPQEEHLSNATPRLRLAFARFHWNDGSDTLLVGQGYALFGDLWPNITWDNLSLLMGTVIGREPQVQYSHVLTLSSGSAITYAVSVNAPNSGLFNQATNTAETSGVPFVHAKIAYTSDALGKADYFGFESHDPIPAQIAISSFTGREKIPKTDGGNQDVNAWGVALNGVLPIVGIRNGVRAGAASIDGQIWLGQHVGSYFGASGQNVYETIGGHVAAIRASGGFVEGKYFFTSKLNLTVSYSVDKNNTDDLARAGVPFRIASGIFSGTTFGAPGVSRAQDFDMALWYHPGAHAFFGFVWDSRKASYNSGQNGSNNRFNLSMFYNF